MKNRTRETCTSGTVRDEGGNILIYSANDRGDRGNVGIIRSPIRASILPDQRGLGCGTVCNVETPGRSALASRRRLLSFVVVIFFVFLELGFFCEKQFLDPPSRGRIGRDFQQFTIVRDVLPCDKAIHDNLSQVRVSCFRL